MSHIIILAGLALSEPISRAGLELQSVHTDHILNFSPTNFLMSIVRTIRPQIEL